MSELIFIRDLLIQRNGRDALKINSLEIQRGETLAIVGPNGAGKSTLLLALAHLIKPARGQMMFNGSPISQMDFADDQLVEVHGKCREHHWRGHQPRRGDVDIDRL